MQYSVEKHFQQLADWLEMESEAERARMQERRKSRSQANAEARGETLLDLVIAEERTGLGGRYLITFVKRNRTLVLPWNRFRVGSPVVATDEVIEGDGGFGIVSRRSATSLEVAFDEQPEGERFRLDLSSDEITRNRQLAALKAIKNASGRIAQMRDVLLGDREPQFDANIPTEIDKSQFDNDVNVSQREAITFALSSRDVAIIHGPPGTGKTTTVAEMIRQAVSNGQKILACAPSNTGVDNLLEKLVRKGLRVVRIGHPARVQEEFQAYTLDSLVESDPGMAIVADMMRESTKIARKAEKFTRAKPAPGARGDKRQEARRLREDAKLYERQIITSVLDKADVICATTNFDPEILGNRHFDTVVIDEACQSTEPGCWPAILKADRIILAGDHCQLPPTILSTEAAKEGFAISLMERLVALYGSKVTKQLSVQYRMHQQIMKYSSDCFYEGQLIAHSSVSSHLLYDLIGDASCSSETDTTWSVTQSAISFVDTAGAGWDEQLEPDGESRFNPEEGAWILKQVSELCSLGIAPSDIAVIGPYAAQVRWIRQRCPFKAVDIDTVDGFQGREKEAILISLVRSNADAEVGFLSDIRRMNVALTRARRKLIIIGDSATLGAHEFYADMIAYFESIGAYQSIWESNHFEA